MKPSSFHKLVPNGVADHVDRRRYLQLTDDRWPMVSTDAKDLRDLLAFISFCHQHLHLALLGREGLRWLTWPIDKPIQQGPSDLTREERLVGGDRSDGADHALRPTDHH